MFRSLLKLLRSSKRLKKLFFATQPSSSLGLFVPLPPSSRSWMELPTGQEMPSPQATQPSLASMKSARPGLGGGREQEQNYLEAHLKDSSGG